LSDDKPLENLTDEQLVEMGKQLGVSVSLPSQVMPEEETPPPPDGEAPPIGDIFTGILPPDVEAVWGGGKLDGSGHSAEETARYLIGQWGLDTFRESAIHQQALAEIEREKRLGPVRAAYVKAMKRKQ
jgi:hypothetical protein